MKIMIVFIIIGGARLQRINDQPKPTVARPFFAQEAHFSPLPQQYAALPAPLHFTAFRRGKAFSQQPAHAFRPTRQCIGHNSPRKDHKIEDIRAEWGDWMRWRSRKCGASVGKTQSPANATIHKNVHPTSAASQAGGPGRQVPKRPAGNVAGVRAMAIKLYLRQIQATFYLRDLYMHYACQPTCLIIIKMEDIDSIDTEH